MINVIPIMKPIISIGHSIIEMNGIYNEQLSKDILDCENLRLSDDPNDTRYEDTELPNTESMRHLISKIDNEIFKINPYFKRHQSWAHILRPGESTMYHEHGLAHRQKMIALAHDKPELRSLGNLDGISYVYYVTYPENSGDLVFELSAVQRRISQNIKPVVGNLVLFPTYIPHYTKRNTSKEIRISISGNYWPDVDKLDEFFREVYDGRSNYFNYVGVYNS